MMKYFDFSNKFKPTKFILAFLFMSSILCKIILSFLAFNNVYLYYNRIINSEIQQYLMYIIVISLGVLLIISAKIKSIKIVTPIICILTVIIINFFGSGFWETDKSNFEFKSPYNKTIIVEEYSWLLDGSINVYQKMNSNIICGLNGTIVTDDGYQPFKNKDFKLEWSINSVKITYGFGSEKIYKSNVFKLK